MLVAGAGSAMGLHSGPRRRTAGWICVFRRKRGPRRLLGGVARPIWGATEPGLFCCKFLVLVAAADCYHTCKLTPSILCGTPTILCGTPSSLCSSPDGPNNWMDGQKCLVSQLSEPNLNPTPPGKLLAKTSPLSPLACINSHAFSRFLFVGLQRPCPRHRTGPVGVICCRGHCRWRMSWQPHHISPHGKFMLIQQRMHKLALWLLIFFVYQEGRGRLHSSPWKCQCSLGLVATCSPPSSPNREHGATLGHVVHAVHTSSSATRRRGRGSSTTRLWVLSSS